MSQTVPGPQAQTQTPPLVVNIQYVKDMSFEVPNAPAIYTQLRAQPQVNINLDVNARRIQENQHVYEVTLMIRAEAREVAPGQTGATQPNIAQSGNGQGGNGQTDGAQTAAGAPTVFVAELAYAGVFTLNNLPENAIEPVLLVECLRILFPFARNILADVTRDGGFPPVLLQPIDFVALWQSRRQPAEATAQA
ncbi:MAG: protein-export chaperone SecB [Alphaproteobacteria bacterium]|nr:protein-export chaperone SecB [Alphaproteobacteria bacterium]